MSNINSTATAIAPAAALAFNVGLRDVGTLIGLIVIVVVFAALTPELPDRAQPRQHPAAVVDQRLRRARHDARHHRRRHRPVGRPDGRHGRRRRRGPDGGRRADRPRHSRRPVFGMAAGAMNGVLVAYGGLQPFIVTLGTLSLYRAVALIYTGGNPIFGIPPAFSRSLQLVPVRRSEPGGDRRRARARRLDRPQQDAARRVFPGGRRQRGGLHIAGVPVAMTKIATYMISGALPPSPP